MKTFQQMRYLKSSFSFAYSVKWLKSPSFVFLVALKPKSVSLLDEVCKNYNETYNLTQISYGRRTEQSCATGSQGCTDRAISLLGVRSSKRCDIMELQCNSRKLYVYLSIFNSFFRTIEV